MIIAAQIPPELLKHLGDVEFQTAELRDMFRNSLYATTPEQYREHSVMVDIDEDSLVTIDIELNFREAETVRDILHEALSAFLNLENDLEIELEIYNEM